MAAAVGGIGAGTGVATAADTQLDPGTWYDATVTDVTDGDTIDVTLDSDGTEYELRLLGIDTPETKRNGRYESVREWEGIEDDGYLADWGERAKEYARGEFPEGTAVQIAVDENEDEEDPFGRLLAYLRYDASGDGSFDTLYNRDVVERGYARVYGSSLTKHDAIWAAEDAAQAAGRRVWRQSDPANTTAVDNDPVDTVFDPDASSVRTDAGGIDPSRVPVFAEPTATQELGADGVAYDRIPLVGVDEAANAALVGGLPIDESLEDDAEGQHQVFLTNLVDYLSSRPGQLLVAGGHREFNADAALSNEDAVGYQRFLEGVGIPFEQVNAFDGAGGNALSTARGIVVTNPPRAYTTAELDALSSFVADGGAVLLMGSAAATATMRSNLDSVAAGLGSDLRLNDDRVVDDDSNAGSRDLLLTSNFDTSFPLFDAYAPDANEAPTCTVTAPSDGETVSGTVTVEVDASDAEDADDALTVEVAIDGGTWRTATYDATAGAYLEEWDTTTVADGSHTVDARATDGDGATTRAATVEVTVDNVASAPTVDSLSVTEVETDDADAEFDVAWTVGDADGDLSSVALSLTDEVAGESEDSASVAVSGAEASGTTRLVAAGDDGSGHDYTVECTVTDAAGNTGVDDVAASETESPTGTPTVDGLSVAEQNGGGDPHAEFDVEWSVGDAAGDLATVDVTLTDLDDGETEGTSSVDVSGGTASGVENYRAKREENSGHTYEAELVVTDAAGNTASATAREVEDGV